PVLRYRKCRDTPSPRPPEGRRTRKRARGDGMVDRAIKVDEQTDRLVADLAYFLRYSKKSIVWGAVAEFAGQHLPRPRSGAGELVEPQRTCPMHGAGEVELER